MCLAGAVLPGLGPDPEFDEFFNRMLYEAGLPPPPLDPPVEGRLYKFLEHGPFRKARTILAVMAPVSLCFVFLSPETKRAIVNRKNCRYVLTDLAPKSAKGYLSILLPKLAVAAFNYSVLPYLVGPDPNAVGWSLGRILYSEVQTLALLCLRYWRPGNHALVRGLASGVRRPGPPGLQGLLWTALPTLLDVLGHRRLRPLRQLDLVWSLWAIVGFPQVCR
ncbi:hypothetical protein PG994_009339 [Apiospora phragmitis]|uniref:Uncharacterized protein n=1 Tax=Apiospora phragmitis TaxID=2905665 RepID=A0ABR1UJ06_9PEZI